MKEIVRNAFRARFSDFDFCRLPTKPSSWPPAFFFPSKRKRRRRFCKNVFLSFAFSVWSTFGISLFVSSALRIDGVFTLVLSFPTFCISSRPSMPSKLLTLFIIVVTGLLSLWFVTDTSVLNLFIWGSAGGEWLVELLSVVGERLCRTSIDFMRTLGDGCLDWAVACIKAERRSDGFVAILLFWLLTFPCGRWCGKLFGGLSFDGDGSITELSSINLKSAPSIRQTTSSDKSLTPPSLITLCGRLRMTTGLVLKSLGGASIVFVKLFVLSSFLIMIGSMVSGEMGCERLLAIFASRLMSWSIKLNWRGVLSLCMWSDVDFVIGKRFSCTRELLSFVPRKLECALFTSSPAIDGARFLMPTGGWSIWTCGLALPELSSSESNAGLLDRSLLSPVALSSFDLLFFLESVDLLLSWNDFFADTHDELFLISTILGCSSDDPSGPLRLESDLSFVSCTVVGVMASLSPPALDSAFDVIPMPAARPFDWMLNYTDCWRLKDFRLKLTAIPVNPALSATMLCIFLCFASLFFCIS